MEQYKNTVYHGDCLEFMRSVPDGFFDLVLTDPPYMIGISNNPIRQKHDKKDWDSKPINPEVFKEMQRVAKNLIVWGGNYFTEFLPSSKGFLIWDKKQPYNFTLAMCEYAYSSFNRPAKMFSYANRSDGVKMHPTQKPLPLMQFCLRYAQEQTDTLKVFDPFMGSGTTAVACVSMGIDWWGCELERDYVDVANSRLSKLQVELF